MSGPERDDFEHVLAIWRAGYFNAKRSVLVLNEHLVAGGRTTQGAFNTIINDPGYDAMLEDGVVSVFMPRLPCMAEMRRAGLSFLDAINGKPGLDGHSNGAEQIRSGSSWSKRGTTRCSASLPRPAQSSGCRERGKAAGIPDRPASRFGASCRRARPGCPGRTGHDGR